MSAPATGPGTTMGRIAALEQAVANLICEVGELRERLDATGPPERDITPIEIIPLEPKSRGYEPRRAP